jgi:hypothetical protein
MKITCSRKLSLDEIEELAVIAKLMDRQKLIKDWTGDGMLYKTTGGNFHFVDEEKLQVNRDEARSLERGRKNALERGRKNVSV